jgi:hypothetical protein
MTMPIKTAISDMTAEQRQHAIATILARGVLRYHRRIRRLDSCPDEKKQETAPEGLEVSERKRLSVSRRTRE